MVRRGLGGAGLMLVPFLLAACTASPSALAPQETTQSNPSEPQPTPAELSEHQRILAIYGGAYTDPRLQATIEQLVERLVAASDRPDLHYKVTILDSPTVNAFALPDGELYVSRGLLALANDESELASVIGHEMGHVIARHAELREQEIRDEELGDRVFTDLVNDPQAGALALAKSKLKIASFSQKQELQADAIGIAITAHAGLDPYGAVRFLASLERNSELRPRKRQAGLTAPDFLSSHPTTPERIADALTTARQYRAPATDTPLERTQARDAYLTDLDGMLYGEDESEGFVRGRRFMHPQLGFTFTAPEGFALDNTAKAVIGVTRHGAAALRFDAVRVPAEQALAAYLTSGWIENIDPKSVQPLTINGFAGATARAKSENWDFRLYAIRFGSAVYRFIFATKKSTAETDRLFRQSVDTFRRMTVAETRQVKPLRVRIVTVKPGDTIEKLAEQMQTPDRRIERFLVLNGLEPGDKLQPGGEVKIVAD